MLSLNELALSIQELEDSTNLRNKNNTLDKNINSSSYNAFHPSNTLLTHGSNRQLFRKCKKLIQQQVLQIDLLSKQNQTLNQQLSNLKLSNTTHTQTITKLSAEISSITSMNHTLHNEMNKLTEKIQNLTQNLSQSQNLIQLANNKNQALEQIVNKLQQQNHTYKDKYQLMQGIIQLMKKENSTMAQVVKGKEQEMRLEVDRLKKFKELLERRNHVDERDLQLVSRFPMTELKVQKNEREELQDLNPLKTIGFSRYPDMETLYQLKNDKNLSDFKTADRTLQKASINKSLQKSTINKLKHQISTINKSMHQISPINKQMYQISPINKPIHQISPFSIVDQKPSLSRIRKNHSKPKPTSTIINHQNQFAQIKIQQKLNPQHALNTSCHTQINPQMQSQLSGIKKQIMKHYNMIQLKKQMMNQGMIGKTLKQIEKKLEKMTRISRVDQSESEFE